VILEVITRLLFHTILVFSLFLLFSGHNDPGGGFAAGLVAGLAMVLRYLAGGRYELGEAAPVDPGRVLGAGLLLAGGTALAGLLLGGEVLESVILQWTVPVLGDVKLVTSLFFDVGVYLIVVGLILDILRSLGAELDREEADERDASDTEDAAREPEEAAAR
jgi:multicomponent Na+:H+ antiporter subunit A